MLITPLTALAPQRVAPGPRMISMRSTSSSITSCTSQKTPEKSGHRFLKVGTPHRWFPFIHKERSSTSAPNAAHCGVARSGSSRRPRQHPLQLVDVGRLGEVGVEAGFEGAPPVLLLAVAGEGDEEGGPEIRVGAEGARHAMAVEPAGEADVAEDDVGPEAPRRLQPRGAVEGHRRLM